MQKQSSSTFVTAQQIKSALGTFKNREQQEHYKKICQLFKPMNIPQSGDWLHGHPEKHQSYSDYKLPNYNQVTPERKTIYLQPFSKFNNDFLNKLCSFCSSFYPKMDVKCLPVLQFSTEPELAQKVKRRKHTYGYQYLAQDILAFMEKNVPKDAYCVMGITLNDIYPGQNWNFVYGWAKYKARVGIFSFLRWDQEYAQGNTKQIDWNLILYPSMRTMVHEIGHMFAITHCVYYRCLMNGFNNIQQNYLNPLQFCPICYRKILKNIGFNEIQRYNNLIQYCQKSEVKQLKIDKKLFQQLLLLKKNRKQANQLDPKIKITHQAKILIGNKIANTNNNIANKTDKNVNRGKSHAPIRHR